ncbi:hypothetical protein DXG01_012984 [Tephrocybe rancida]|nr:hypothetical protein DXG01_012984 [Tephrocybe rancida]
MCDAVTVDSDGLEDIYSNEELEEWVIEEVVDLLEDREDELDSFFLETLEPHPPEEEANASLISRDRPVETSSYKVYHPNRAGSLPTQGLNLLQALEKDKYAHHRNNGNPHYPFASQTEWELVQWMNDASLTQQQIDAFLRLSYVKQNPISIKSARDMRARIEALPTVPKWQHQTFTYPGYKTKDPITIFWRNPLDVVKDLYANPIFTPCLEHNPYRLYPSPTSTDRMYTEFMSGDFAWDYQSTLPPGHSFVGIILASDKTPLTIGTGNREMHPLLISITNIDAGVRMKATSRSFALIAYLPIVKFVDVTDHEQSILKARLFHLCLDKILGPLKAAERTGERMADSVGGLRVVHTPLAVYIADYPEQQLVSCVSGSQSPVTTAHSSQFGDQPPGGMHPPRTRNVTLFAISQAVAKSDPYPSNSARALEPFWRVCQSYGLNGVTKPFWVDWGSACPSIFLAHDPLHGLHKFFWDHVVKWAINIMTGPELDARLKILQPRVGVRHWANGVSKLTQVTGREYRELEKVFIAVINGAVDSRVMCALRALLDFIFQSQSLVFYDETCEALSAALSEFHDNKQAIVDAGGRRGKKGIINHFRIPKLEMLHIIIRSACLLGAPYQWTSDITERCHITHVKTPYRRSNRRNFHEQCARFMDRVEKLNLFGLFVALKRNNTSLLNEMETETTAVADHYPEQTWLSRVLPHDQLVSNRRCRKTLFDKKKGLISVDEMTVISLNIRAHQQVLIDAMPSDYGLADLRPALGDYLGGLSYSQRKGQRKSGPMCPLPFSSIDVWNNFRIQHRSLQDSRLISPHFTVQALPPDFESGLPFGRCNTVLIADDVGNRTFRVVGGCRVAQIRLIFRPANTTLNDQLVYAEFFKFASEHTEIDENGDEVYIPAPDIDMFLVHRHLRGNKSRMGDVLQLAQMNP